MIKVPNAYNPEDYSYINKEHITAVNYNQNFALVISLINGDIIQYPPGRYKIHEFVERFLK